MVTELDPTKYWECKECGLEHVTKLHQAHVPMHNCRARSNMTTPLVEKGSKSKQIIVQREDYVGSEKGLTYHDGKPVMAVVTEREDGSNDTHVYPGIAIVDTKSNE